MTMTSLKESMYMLCNAANQHRCVHAMNILKLLKFHKLPNKMNYYFRCGLSAKQIT